MDSRNHWVASSEEGDEETLEISINPKPLNPWGTRVVAHGAQDWPMGQSHRAVDVCRSRFSFSVQGRRARLR